MTLPKVKCPACEHGDHRYCKGWYSHRDDDYVYVCTCRCKNAKAYRERESLLDPRD